MPGHIAPGSVSDFIGYFGDFVATAAELAGTEPPRGLDSLSFVPALLGKPGQQQHDYLYWEYHENNRFVQAVRRGDWKGVRFGLGEPLELYNLKTDLGETRNVAAEHPEVVKQIEHAMKQAHVDSPYWPIPQSGPAGGTQGGRAANRTELPLGRSGPLPLVADLSKTSRLAR